MSQAVFGHVRRGHVMWSWKL